MTKKIRIKKNKIIESKQKKSEEVVVKQINDLMNKTFSGYIQDLVEDAAKSGKLSEFIDKKKLNKSLKENQNRHILTLESYKKEIEAIQKYMLNSLLGCKTISDLINNITNGDLNSNLDKSNIIRSINEIDNAVDLNKSIEISKKDFSNQEFDKKNNDLPKAKEALIKVKDSLCKDFYLQNKTLEDFYEKISLVINNKIKVKEDEVISNVKALQEEIKSIYKTLSSYKEYFDDLNNFKF